MRKILLLVLVFFFTSFFTAAQASDTDGLNGYSFSLGVSVGLLAGQSEEILYISQNMDYKASQLLWNMKPLIYASAELNYKFQLPVSNIRFFVNTQVKFGFPGNTGIMEDRDWTATPFYPDWLTHYSVQDNKTEKAILVDGKIGASFVVFEDFLIKPFVSYSLMMFSWVASKGSYLYPSTDGGHFDYFDLYNAGDIGSPTAPVGTYRQTWHIISPGVSFYGKFNRYFDIELFLRATPLAWCKAVDEHLLRNLVITDTMFGGLFLEPALLFSFKPNPKLSFSFSFAYRYINGTRGDCVYTGDEVYTTYGVPSIKENDLSGTGYSVFDAGIFVKYNVF